MGRVKIDSVITMDVGGETMRNKRKDKSKDKGKEEAHVSVSTSDDAISSESIESKNPKSPEGKHQYKSHAKSDKNRFFHGVKNTNDGVKQNVKVEVNIDQGEDCLTSCLGALGSCFGKAAKSAM